MEHSSCTAVQGGPDLDLNSSNSAQSELKDLTRNAALPFPLFSHLTAGNHARKGVNSASS